MRRVLMLVLLAGSSLFVLMCCGIMMTGSGTGSSGGRPIAPPTVTSNQPAPAEPAPDEKPEPTAQAEPPQQPQPKPEPPPSRDDDADTFDPRVDPAVLARLLQQREERIATGRFEAKRRSSVKQKKAILEEVEAIETGRTIYVPPVEPPFKVEDFGHAELVVQIVSIAGSQDFLGMVDLPDGDTQIAWFRGWNTASLTTDQKVSFDETIHVTGLESYITVLGSMSRVVRIETIDLQPYRAAIARRGRREQAAEQPMQRTAAEEAAANVRAAEAKLRLARQFFDRGDDVKGMEWLQELIEDYPETPAAKEAAELLKM